MAEAGKRKARLGQGGRLLGYLCTIALFAQSSPPRLRLMLAVDHQWVCVIFSEVPDTRRMSEFGIRQRGEGQVLKWNGSNDELSNKIIGLNLYIPGILCGEK